MDNNILYVADVDPLPEQFEEFYAWFASRHAPDLVRLGFRSCASYVTLRGGLAMCDIYEIPTEDILKGSGYTDMHANDPYGEHVLRDLRIRKRAYSFYRQRLLTAKNGSSDLPLLNADGMTMIRFAADDVGASAIGAAFAGKLGTSLFDAGAMRIRAGDLVPHPRDVPAEFPNRIVLIEWNTEAPPATGDDAWRELCTQHGASEFTIYAGRRTWPWPDSGRGAVL